MAAPSLKMPETNNGLIPHSSFVSSLPWSCKEIKTNHPSSEGMYEPNSALLSLWARRPMNMGGTRQPIFSD